MNVSARLIRAIVHAIDAVSDRVCTPDDAPAHQRTGRRGEEDAYFHLRSLGYVMVARNYRSHRRRGEIDLIGWDGDVLCFVEVKTRTSHDIKPAEAAVDHAKRHELSAVAREYLRHLPHRASGASTLSAYTMRSDKPAGPNSSYSRMLSACRKMRVSASIVKGFSVCLS
jgi:Holliday junction resolvase-like predicted endonuclease